MMRCLLVEHGNSQQNNILGLFCWLSTVVYCPSNLHSGWLPKVMVAKIWENFGVKKQKLYRDFERKEMVQKQVGDYFL